MRLQMLKIGKTRLLVSNTQMVSKSMNGFRGPFINDIILKSEIFYPCHLFQTCPEHGPHVKSALPVL